MSESWLDAALGSTPEGTPPSPEAGPSPRRAADAPGTTGTSKPVAETRRSAGNWALAGVAAAGLVVGAGGVGAHDYLEDGGATAVADAQADTKEAEAGKKTETEKAKALADGVAAYVTLLKNTDVLPLTSDAARMYVNNAAAREVVGTKMENADSLNSGQMWKITVDGTSLKAEKTTDTPQATVAKAQNDGTAAGRTAALGEVVNAVNAHLEPDVAPGADAAAIATAVASGMQKERAEGNTAGTAAGRRVALGEVVTAVNAHLDPKVATGADVAAIAAAVQTALNANSAEAAAAKKAADKVPLVVGITQLAEIDHTKPYLNDAKQLPSVLKLAELIGKSYEAALADAQKIRDADPNKASEKDAYAHFKKIALYMAANAASQKINSVDLTPAQKTAIIGAADMTAAQAAATAAVNGL